MKIEYGELAQLPEKTERFSLRKRTVAGARA